MPSSHPKLTANLVLIGGRGCGKSSISKRLARCNKHFMLFSLDALVRYEAGAASIPEIVNERGWDGFRELEFDVVEKVARFQSGALIDCGGGVVVDVDETGREIFSERKVEALRRHGRVIYLRRDPHYLAGRVANDPNRPALSDQQSFLEIMARREPWYLRAAHRTVECGTRSKEQITNDILHWFLGEATTP